MNQVTNSTKAIIILLLFFFSSISFLSAQKITIQGQVLLNEEENAYGALITLQDSFQQVVNENGDFFFELDEPLSSVKFSISFLGYENLDTIIFLNDSFNSYKFDFTLEKKIFEISEVTVTDQKELNLFDKTNWTILDMVIYDESFFLIAIDENIRYLFQYSKEGSFLAKEKMKKINSFQVSCLGSLYVQSNSRCYQLSVGEKIEIVADMGISKFNENLKPCVAYHKSKMVYEFLSNHNKRKEYVKIWDQGRRKTIASIFDKDAEKVARSYYYEIIRTYSQTIANPDESGIDTGIGKPNIVADGTWDGDLTRLMISNELGRLVSNYLKIESKPIQVLNFFYQEKLYLLDYVNQDFLSFDANNDFTKEKLDLDLDWNIQLKVLNAQLHQAIYFFSKNDIYKMNTNNDRIQIFKFYSIPDDLAYQKAIGIDDEFVYVIGRKDINIPKMMVKKYSLNE